MRNTTRQSHEPVDVLLTYPRDGLRLFQSMVPIGLVSIGTVLRNAGYRVSIIDFNHYSGDFRRELLVLRPKMIGIGGTTSSRAGSFLTARLAKKILPDTPVVYGGINATFTTGEVLENIPQIDYVIRGEGELSFLMLCNSLLRKAPGSLTEIPGLCWFLGTQKVENKPQRINDLSLLPIPDRDLLCGTYNLEMEFIGGTGDFLMTSRGCPAACNFCSAARMFPGGVRVRPMDSVMAEIDYLRTRKNLSGLKLFDSTFTADRSHVENFCTNVKKFNLPWECEVRADTVDTDLLRLMKESGCYYINIGMETSNPGHLKRISKGITPEQVLTTLTSCRNIGIRSKVFFTFGHLGQTFNECMEDIGFIATNRDRIDFFAVTVGMRIYPGTRLEKECRYQGLQGDRFSWMKNAKTIRNLLVFEPGDVPVLFQKQLGPVRLFLVLAILFWKKLICTEAFLLRMVVENAKGIAGSINLAIIHSIHRLKRVRNCIRQKHAFCVFVSMKTTVSRKH